jgi:hypothetical protein
MVTAELAACLPVLAILAAVAVFAVSAAGERVRLQDAAREAARSAARGAPSIGRLLAQRAAPGATVQVAAAGSSVVATARIRLAPLGGWLPAISLEERAVAAREPAGDSG